MATYTSHLNLKLPDYSDTADIKDLNDNFKKIDDAIASGGDGGGTGGGIVTETDPTVPSWAKQPSKPTYTAAEVGALPDTTVIPTVPSALPNPQPIVINGISYDGSERKEITVSAGDGGSITETDPTVPAWAKAEKKPSYTAEEVGALPSTYEPPVTSVNGKTGAVSLVASDVGALPNTTVIPTVPTSLKNPYPLTINGVEYDGSEAKTVTIESTGGGASVELDTTLTQYNKAADAGAVGNAIAQETAAREAAVNSLNQANAKQDTRIKALEDAGGIVTVEPADGDVPLIFYGDALPQTKTSTVMPISYVSKTLKYNGSAETKAQGTSSMSYAKKNQTTKFDRKLNFKSWGEQSKFCFKANWIDLTHARNIVSAQLWGDVVKSRANYADLPELLRTSPNQGAIDGFPVLVYANGVYQGRYTINIPKDGWMANMDKTLDAHCILCGENYVSGCFRAAANIDGSDWSDELHDTVPATIKTRWNEIISFVMNSTDDEFAAGIGDYFYLDSLIDYYIFGVVSCGLDAFGKNQLYMTYDGQKWIATMYDMDSTWGLWWNGSSFVATDYSRTEFQDFKDGSGNLLYIRLEELFYDQIQARWAELKDGVLSYANIMTRFERFIEIVPPHIIKEDYASTTGGGNFTGIPSQNTNHIQQLRAYVAARLPYADEWFASLTPAEEIPCTGITLDQTMLTFTGVGTQTLTATVTPSDTTDTVVWATDADAVATVRGGVVTAVGNGSATITAKCGEYSATCSVSVSGIETDGGGEDDVVIDFSHNALSGVAWLNNAEYDDQTGLAVDNAGAYSTEHFSLQPCLYEVKSVYSKSAELTVSMWDSEGAYCGMIRCNNKSAVIYVWGITGYTYALRCYDASASGVEDFNVSMVAVDNSETFIMKTLDMGGAFTGASSDVSIDVATKLGITDADATNIKTSNWPIMGGNGNYTEVFVSDWLKATIGWGGMWLSTTKYGSGTSGAEACNAAFAGRTLVFN